MAQFAVLFGTICFPVPIVLYKLHVLLTITNFVSLYLNISLLLKATNISYKLYTVEIARIISLACLLIFIMAIYHIQISSANEI